MIYKESVMKKVYYGQPFGEKRIVIQKHKYLEGNQRESMKVLGLGYYVPSWRKKHFTPREEMQAILNVFPRFKLVKEYWDFVDVAFDNGFECGRGGVTNTNFGRGGNIFLVHPKTGCALSMHIQSMMARKAKKLTIKYFDENTDCGGWTWGQSKIFYSCKSLDKFLKNIS